MNGIEAAAAIHALRPDVPIVLVTGYGEIPPEAGSSFVGMLAKPFDVAEMKQVIAKHVHP
jgi:CheY-like chemotaxis protein